MKSHRAGDGERSLAVFIDFENMGLGFNAQAAYVLRMGVSLRLLEKASETLIDDIHWLTRQELRDYNVVNTE